MQTLCKAIMQYSIWDDNFKIRVANEIIRQLIKYFDNFLDDNLLVENRV